jgi:O-methyltransferase involved in polyketide biosynthesis
MPHGEINSSPPASGQPQHAAGEHRLQNDLIRRQVEPVVSDIATETADPPVGSHLSPGAAFTTDSAITVRLSGVSETLLWPLYARACEARRPESPLRDPKAIELVHSIDYPFEAQFGRPRQVLGLRELSFDDHVRDFLARHPRGTVVALADGLNTQFWRLDNGQAHWLSIDLPEVIEVRRALLPDTERSLSIACSALDFRWTNSVDPRNGVFITAQGLLMYLHECEVHELIIRCAKTFPGATMMFDAMPRLFTASIRGNTIVSAALMRGRRSGKNSYRLPPMPWSSTFESMRKRLQTHPNISNVHYGRLPRGRGLIFKYVAPLMHSVPGVRSATPWNAVIEFS